MFLPKTIIGIMMMTMVAEIAWADGPLRRFGLIRGAACRRGFRSPMAGPAPAPCTPTSDERVRLQWKFQVGKTFYMTMNTKTSQEMIVMGRKISQAQDVTYYISFTPLERDDNGNWKIKQKTAGLKLETEIGGNKIQFDSTQKGARGKPLSDFFEALVGSEFILTVDRNMKITKIDGRDEFLKKLLKEKPQMEPLLKTILSEEALKQMSEPAFGMVPDKPVRKGDAWEKKTSLDMSPIGTFDTNYKYTYEGPDENNLQKIKVDTTLKYGPPGPNALPFKILKADLASKESTGNILFDSAKGRVGGSDMTMHLAGTLTIEISGMSSVVTLDQTQTTKVKTTDENPIQKK